MTRTRDIAVIDAIQNQKAKEIEEKEPHPLDPEGVRMAEHKRFTFDIINTPVDPLR